MINLDNDILSISLKDQGAELTSIISKEDGTEYLWQADPKVWGRHAPILFPIVGKLKNDKYTYQGNSYNMGQHGFARDLNFNIVSKDKNSAEFVLEDNNVTFKKYPFKFRLKVKYELLKNQIIVTYEVENKDNKEILFSVGAHPGFNCPLSKGERMEDYYLEFEEKETLDTYVLRDGVLDSEKVEFIRNSNIIALSKELFKKDAIILEKIKSSSIRIKSSRNKRSVRVQFDGFPFVGIWSKPDGADFICIEPWYGIADSIKSTGELEDKKGIIKLAAGENFQCSFSIVIE